MKKKYGSQKQMIGWFHENNNKIVINDDKNDVDKKYIYNNDFFNNTGFCPWLPRSKLMSGN